MEKRLPIRSFGTVLSRGENSKFPCYFLDYYISALFMSSLCCRNADFGQL